MKSFKKNIFFFICIIFINLNLFASNNFKILTKVGNEIITSFELENKIKTTLFLSGEELNQSNIDQIKNLSLNSLINFKLKKEEIKKYNIKNNNDLRLSKYLENLAKKFNVDRNELEILFSSNGLDLNLFLEEIKTEFLWQNLIYKIYSKKVNLDEKAITEELNKVISNQKSITEYNLSEIETKILNESEIDELKRYIDKFSFKKAAQKFSLSNTSLDGGNIGWINSKSLSSEMQKIIKNLKIGQYSEPIRRDENILIYYINDKREISNFSKQNLEKLKESIINKQTNDLLNIYSNNHLSIKKNNTLIEYQ